MEKAFEVLLVSCGPENRKALFGVFRDLPVKAHTISTLAEVRRYAAVSRIDLVFCEEQLSDGSYREVFSELRTTWPSARFVLLMGNGEWTEYLEALRLGVAEVLRPPLLPIDIDLALIHSSWNTRRDWLTQ